MGVVCECAAVRKLARAIHMRVAEVLTATGVNVTAATTTTPTITATAGPAAHASGGVAVGNGSSLKPMTLPAKLS